MKLMLLVIPALCIDALQALVSLSLAGITAGLAWIPIVNIAAAPVGIALGFTISVCLSLTLGWLVVGLLVYYDMFYPGITAMAFIGEEIPGFNLLPSWTALVIASYIRKMKEGSVAGKTAAQTATTLAASPTVRAMRTAQNKTNLTAVKKAFRVGNETNAKTA